MSRLPFLLLALAACDQAPSKLDVLAATSGPRTHEIPRPGFQPLTELRYRLAPTPYETRLDTKISTRTSSDLGISQPVARTPVQDSFRISQNNLTLELAANEATVDGPAGTDAIDYIHAWRGMLVNKRITAAFSQLGELASIEVAGEPNSQFGAPATEQIRQRLLALVVPLPDLAIGESGQWRVVTTFEQNGLEVQQVGLYTLLARENGRWKIRIHLQRHAEDQNLGGVRLVSLFRAIDGTVVVDPARLIPISGELATESHLHTRTGVVDRVLEDSGTLMLSSKP